MLLADRGPDRVKPVLRADDDSQSLAAGLDRDRHRRQGTGSTGSSPPVPPLQRHRLLPIA